MMDQTIGHDESNNREQHEHDDLNKSDFSVHNHNGSECTQGGDNEGAVVSTHDVDTQPNLHGQDRSSYNREHDALNNFILHNLHNRNTSYVSRSPITPLDCEPYFSADPSFLPL